MSLCRILSTVCKIIVSTYASHWFFFNKHYWCIYHHKFTNITFYSKVILIKIISYGNTISCRYCGINWRACSKTWSGLVLFGLVWSHLVDLILLVWFGLVSMDFYWSSLYFSLFHYFLFKLYIINHDVIYWCCLFFNSHSNELYQYFLYYVYDLICIYLYDCINY